MRPTASTGATKFLSTLSLRRATAPPYNLMIHHKNFYPRSPCGERRFSAGRESDTTKFLSTLSLRRATSANCNCRSARPISIHALLAESDDIPVTVICNVPISIHALLAESDQYWATRARAAQLFLSTLSLRRATRRATGTAGSLAISIHALLAESDDARKHRTRGAV